MDDASTRQQKATHICTAIHCRYGGIRKNKAQNGSMYAFSHAFLTRLLHIYTVRRADIVPAICRHCRCTYNLKYNFKLSNKLHRFSP